jgi:hypothetical protein
MRPNEFKQFSSAASVAIWKSETGQGESTEAGSTPNKKGKYVVPRHADSKALLPSGQSENTDGK